MKIVHIHDYYMDGWGYQENLLPRYQQKLGHDVVIITSDRTRFVLPGKQNRIVGEGTYYDSGVRVIRLKTRFEFKYRFVTMDGLYEAIAQEKPDYLFVHQGVNSTTLLTAANYKKKHPSTFLVTDNHSDLDNCATNPLWRFSYYRTFWRYLVKSKSKFVDLFFGVTPVRCYFMERELGVSHEKIRLLPIGADEDGANAAKCFVSKQTDVIEGSARALKVVTGGKWGKEKSLETLLQAIEDLDVKLTVFGKYPDSSVINAFKNAKKNLTFLGWQNREETFGRFATADIAIWPRHHTTLVEDAVAACLPLVLRYHGNTSHFVRGNGVYLFGGGFLEMRQVFELLSNSPDLLEEMKKASVKQLNLLSYNRVSQESIDYYKDQSPKYTHNVIMNDPLCDPDNTDFYKLTR